MRHLPSIVVVLCACGGGETPPAAIADVELVIAMQAPAETVPLGSLAYRMIIKNAGPDDAEDVRFTHELTGGGSIFDIMSPVACTNLSSEITCDIPVLAIGAMREIAMSASAPQTPGPFASVTEVSAASTDPDLLDNLVVHTTTVIGAADLSVVFDGFGTTVPVGQQNFYSIQIANAGPTLANDVVVLIENLDGLTIDQQSSTDFICDQGTVTRTCTRPFFFPGTSNITIGTIAPAPGTFRLRATITSSTPGDDTDNNTATATTTVTP